MVSNFSNYKWMDFVTHSYRTGYSSVGTANVPRPRVAHTKVCKVHDNRELVAPSRTRTPGLFILGLLKYSSEVGTARYFWQEFAVASTATRAVSSNIHQSPQRLEKSTCNLLPGIFAAQRAAGNIVNSLEAINT